MSLFRVGRSALIGRTMGARLASTYKPSFFEGNNFEGFEESKRHEEEHAAKSAALWKNLSFFVAAPITIAIAIYALGKEVEHKKQPRAKFVPYEHLRRRVKPFPWGDGNHTLFHNKQMNALPDGYEVPDPNNPHCEQISEDPPRWN